jgi:alginate O-acetyltransferase complex protein AlgI
MGATETLLLAASLFAVAAFWLSPASMGQSVVAATTALALLVVAPLSAVWLIVTIAATPPLMLLGDRINARGPVAFIWIAALAAAFFAARTAGGRLGDAVTLVGGAYFTLRHIHVVMEWWLGRLRVPTLAEYARYHLLLPVIVAGPIHRLPHFERQCARRRWDPTEFFSGAERALIGLFLAVAVGNFVFAHLDAVLAAPLGTLHPFVREWALSAVDWVRLYVQFSGLTDLALGLSLMMGLRLEENFDRPWRARDLLDFWNRWHMTLSHWCRDYVYVPIAAHFRAPVAGVFAAMLVLGLWHETSAYYVLWAVWQSLGIVLARLYRNLRRTPREKTRPGLLGIVLVPLGILAWVSAARPIIAVVVGMLPP